MGAACNGAAENETLPPSSTPPPQIQTTTSLPTPTATVQPTATPTVAPQPTPTSSAQAQPESGTLALEVLVTLTVEAEHREGYDRGLFTHWTDADSDGCDTRQEVLMEETLEEPVMSADHRCRVASGVWVSLYDGARLTDPSGLDIDHVVPLAEAWESGAWAWDAGRREAFANDLQDRKSLIAVTAASNRSKGADDPPEWMPPDAGYACAYLAAWVAVKARWDLVVDPRERDFIADRLSGACQGTTLDADPPAVSVPTAAPAPTATPRPTDTPSAVSTPQVTYASCEEAAAAGEQRVQGSSGSGRGFPAATVPSARDGDNDGVVCER